LCGAIPLNCLVAGTGEVQRPHLGGLTARRLAGRAIWHCRWHLLAVCALAFGSVGCGQALHRAETELRPDGSLERAILQPVTSTPEEAIAATRWTAQTYSPAPTANQEVAPIKELPIVGATPERPYFAAWGRFAGAEEIPDYLVFRSELAGRDGRLRRSLAIRDYGFVLEYDWSETLTDVVLLDDLHAACDELAALAAELVPTIVERFVGEGCSASKLKDWLLGEGKNWFRELVDACYEYAAANREGNSPPPARRLAEICARHGLAIDALALADRNKRQAIVKKFVRALLDGTLTFPEGESGNRGRVDELLDALFDAEQPARKAGLDQNPEEARLSAELTAITNDLLRARFGASDDGSTFDARPLVALSQRIWGIYRSPILSIPRRFHFVMKVPGRIERTNGQLRDDGEVEWSFTDEQAYPLGFTMQCRALRVDHKLQQALLPGLPLDKWANVLAVAREARGHEDLASSLRACRAEKSLAPFNRYRHFDASTPEASRAAGAVHKALGSPR
jgi:hypothetical protein